MRKLLAQVSVGFPEEFQGSVSASKLLIVDADTPKEHPVEAHLKKWHNYAIPPLECQQALHSKVEGSESIAVICLLGR